MSTGIQNVYNDRNRKRIPNFIFNNFDLSFLFIEQSDTGNDGYVHYTPPGNIQFYDQPDPSSNLDWDTPRQNSYAGGTGLMPHTGGAGWSTWYCRPLIAPRTPSNISASKDNIGGIVIDYTSDTQLESAYTLYWNDVDDKVTASSSTFNIDNGTGGDPPGIAWAYTTPNVSSTVGGDFSSVRVTLNALISPVVDQDTTYYIWFELANEHGTSDHIKTTGAAQDPSEDFDLTIKANDERGSITSSNPNNCAHPPTTEATGPCRGEVVFGTEIFFNATPDNNFSVEEWTISPSEAGPIEFLVTDPSGVGKGLAEARWTFNHEGDVTIGVSFLAGNCQFTLNRASEEGCVSFVNPVLSVPCSGGVETINPNTYSTVTVKAVPNSKKEVDNWILNTTGTGGGITVPAVIQPDKSSSYTLTIYGQSEIEVTAVFKDETPCVTKTLTVETEGNGSVNYSTGTYCSTNPALSLIPLPDAGNRFVEWIFDQGDPDNFYLNGITLVAKMDKNRTATAVFAKVLSTGGFVVDDDAIMFYCPSDDFKDNVVSFDFSQDESPSAGNLYHFRLNFYSDINKSKLVYSTFSLSDNKRWFVRDNSFNQLSSDGEIINFNETKTIVYDPEVLPHQITESQKPHLVSDFMIYEKPLICGIRYYVEIQAYDVSTNSIINIETISLMLDCNRIDPYYWNHNEDKNNWLCSGQGKTDLQVCGGFGQAINPSIASNMFGVFQLIWQGRRVGGSSNIYGALWDSAVDYLYSSGQGRYDILEMSDPTSDPLVNNAINNPIVLRDHADNFYMTGSLSNKIRYKACNIKRCPQGTPGDTTEGTLNFEAFCFPGSTEFLSSSYDEIKMRIYEEDISGSLVVNDEKVIPVIDKKLIKLDIEGLAGSYAVRLRNMEDPEWSEWINIGNKLSGEELGEDIEHDAFRIDNSRFIVDWNIDDNYNGLRRICCQVLTMYGISNTFCIDILANFDVVQHLFEFYTDTAFTVPFPAYKGQYVLSIDFTIDTKTITADNPKPESAKVYFKVIFSEPIYKDGTTVPNPTGYSDDEIRFNVIQQGINDKRDQGLKKIDDKTFSGEFEIFGNDEIFNKDGAAFIELIFPNTVAAEFCGSDETDNYNFVNSDQEEIANIDLVPIEIYHKYQSDRLSKVLDINKFRQNYDKDDTNFKFGNPGYYRK